MLAGHVREFQVSHVHVACTGLISSCIIKFLPVQICAACCTARVQHVPALLCIGVSPGVRFKSNLHFFSDIIVDDDVEEEACPMFNQHGPVPSLFLVTV